MLTFAGRKSKTSLTVEARKFKNRREQADYYAQLRGWKPLTEEDRAAIDDAVRMVTNLKPKMDNALPNAQYAQLTDADFPEVSVEEYDSFVKRQSGRIIKGLEKWL